MDCGTKTLIFFTLCTLVGANREIKTDLEILISVPSTHIGDTEIESAILTVTAGHPFMYTVVAQKNETQCINSTDPRCSSLIKEPALNVSVTSRSSDGSRFSDSYSINGSRLFLIHVDPEVSVTPQIVVGENDRITVILDIMYDTAKTSRGSLSSRRRPTMFTLITDLTTMIIGEDNGQGNGQGNGQENGQENGQSALGCAPVSALILLALTPLLLLQ